MRNVDVFITYMVTINHKNRSVDVSLIEYYGDNVEVGYLLDECKVKIRMWDTLTSMDNKIFYAKKKLMSRYKSIKTLLSDIQRVLVPMHEKEAVKMGKITIHDDKFNLKEAKKKKDGNLLHLKDFKKKNKD